MGNLSQSCKLVLFSALDQHPDDGVLLHRTDISESLNILRKKKS